MVRVPPRRTRWSPLALAGILAVAGLGIGTSGAIAALGGITPIGCIQNTGETECTNLGGTAPGLGGAWAVALSPDGKNVYVAGTTSNTVAVFTRTASGGLTPGGCIQNTGGTSCAGIGGNSPGLGGARGVVVSPDGKNVYVVAVGSNALVAFSRDANGGLANAGCIQNIGGTDCTGLGGTSVGLRGASGVAISPDGKNVYVASAQSSALVVFSRDANGALAPAGCIQQTGGTDCTSVGGTAPGLIGATDVAVSPDGKNVYVASPDSHAIAVFTRSATGGLTPGGCIQNTGGTECTNVGGTTAGLARASGVAVTPDGKNVYVASFTSGAIVAFSRSASTGGLAPAGCVQNTGGTACTNVGGTAAGLAGAVNVDVSPDGKTVYVATFLGDAIVLFSRSATGGLTSGGCIQATGGTDCASVGGTAAGLNGAHDVAVSPDGKNVYVAANNSRSIVAFAREQAPNQAPSCSPAAVGTASGGSIAVTLACSDPDGNALTRSIVTPPAHGSLGAINQASGLVTYTANVGYAGPDSFTFQASDGLLTSAPATASITVGAVGGPPANLSLSTAPAATGTPATAVIVWGTAVRLNLHIAGLGGNRLVQLETSKDRATWTSIGSQTTTADGNASLDYRPSDNRYYRATFAGDPDLGPGASAIVRVVVRSIILLRPTNGGAVKAVGAGTSITFTATARPNRPELPQAMANFVVYRIDGGRSVQVLDRTVAVNRTTGKATLTIAFSSRGRFYVRAQLVPTPFNANSGWTPIERFDVV